MSRAKPALYVVADHVPRIVRHEDSPQERLNKVSSGLFGPLRRLASDDDAEVVAAARDIVARLALADLTTTDLADKLDSDPRIIWFPVVKLPAAHSAAHLRLVA